MKQAEPRSLPPRTVELLFNLRHRMVMREPDLTELEPAIAEIAKLPPRSLLRISTGVRATLLPWHDPASGQPAALKQWLLQRRPGSQWIDAEWLTAHSRAANLLLFDASGFAREAALKTIDWPADGPLFVAAIVARLNDWVPQVRAAAEGCAARVFPLTDPAVLAEAFVALLDTLSSWSRWGEFPAILDTTIDRPDVAARLAAIFMQTGEWRLASLNELLKRPSLDAHLLELARHAARPEARVVALRTLIRGEVRWITGYDWQWADKSLGRRQAVPKFSARPVIRPLPLDDLVEIAASDRSSQVRRVAAAALYEQGAQLSSAKAIAERLTQDRTASIRKRAEFFLKSGG